MSTRVPCAAQEASGEALAAPWPEEPARDGPTGLGALNPSPCTVFAPQLPKSVAYRKSLWVSASRTESGPRSPADKVRAAASCTAGGGAGMTNSSNPEQHAAGPAVAGLAAALAAGGRRFRAHWGL